MERRHDLGHVEVVLRQMERLARVTEIICFPLDGSLSTMVVAPNLSDLNASGGGADDYSKQIG